MPVIEIDINTARMNAGLERSSDDLRQMGRSVMAVNSSIHTLSSEIRTATTSINNTSHSIQSLERALNQVEASTRQLTQGMASLQQPMDTASSSSRALERNMGTIQGIFKDMPKGVGALIDQLKSLGATLAGAFTVQAAVDAAKDFEYALYQCTKVTDESTDKIREKILQLPEGLGTYTELTTGYYQTISAGVTDPVKAMETLQSASKLAAVAEVSQSDAIRALTKMMAGYRGEIKNTTQAASLLLDIEQYGQTSTKELVPVIGDISSISKAAGVSFKEMGASLSVLTQTAGSTAQAATQLKALETSLLNSNETMTKIIAALGSKSATELIGKHGLAGALSLIEQAAKKSGIELAKVYGSSEAFMAASGIAANNFKGFADALEQMGVKSERLNESFDLLSNTTKDKMDSAKEAFTNVLTLVGEQFIPVVKGGLEATTKTLNENKDKFVEWGRQGARVVEALADTFSSLKGVIDGILSILPDGSGYAVAGGLIGFRLFGPAGVLIGVISAVAIALASMFDAIDKRVGGILADATAAKTLAAAGSGAASGGLIDWEEAGVDAATINVNDKSAANTIRNRNWKEEPFAVNVGKVVSPHIEAQQGIVLDTLKGLERKKETPKEASTNKTPKPSSTSPTLPKNFRPPLIGGKKGGGGSKKTGKTDAEILAENSARYQVNLSKLRNEVEALEASVDGTTSAYDRQVKAIEAEKQATISNADITAQETIRRKQATAEQANETAQLQKRKAELVAQQKIDQLNTKTLQDKANFYKELATATKDDSVAIETQVALIEKQKQLWIDMGIPIQDVNRLYEIQKQKITATPWEKCKTHMQDYFKSASDWSENFNQIWDSTMDNLSDALTEFVKSGELNFQKLLDSFISMCIKMQMQAAVSGLFEFAGRAIGGFITGSGSNNSTPAGNDNWFNTSAGRENLATRFASTYSATGNVFSGGNLSDYSNSIVTQPIFFGYDKHLSLYAKGTGLMGEAGPEAIMPLTRMSNGNLGVQATGQVPEINITVINQGGDATAKVSQQRTNSSGGMDIELMISKVVASDIASRNGGIVAKAIQSTYGVKRYVRGV